jgi:hypothetical protein
MRRIRISIKIERIRNTAFTTVHTEVDVSQNAVPVSVSPCHSLCYLMLGYVRTKSEPCPVAWKICWTP